MSHLAREIAAQPQILADLIRTQAGVAQAMAGHIRARAPSYAMIAARGSSDNAARYAQYLFGALLRLPVALATPSLFTLAGTPPRLGPALVLGVSQSGQSPDVVAVLEAGRDQLVAGLLEPVVIPRSRQPEALVVAVDSRLAHAEQGLLVDLVGRKHQLIGEPGHEAEDTAGAQHASHLRQHRGTVLDQLQHEG